MRIPWVKLIPPPEVYSLMSRSRAENKKTINNANERVEWMTLSVGEKKPTQAAVKLLANGDVGEEDAVDWVPHLFDGGSVAWFPKRLTPEEQAAADAAKVGAGPRLKSFV